MPQYSMPKYSLYDAKTHLSSLVDRAAAREPITIMKNGVPLPQLTPLVPPGQRRMSAHALGVERIDQDFDELDPRIETLFGGSM